MRELRRAGCRRDPCEAKDAEMPPLGLDLDIVNGMDAYISIMGQELDGNVHLADFVHRIESVIAVGLFTGGLFMSLLDLLMDIAECL